MEVANCPFDLLRRLTSDYFLLGCLTEHLISTRRALFFLCLHIATVKTKCLLPKQNVAGSNPAALSSNNIETGTCLRFLFSLNAIDTVLEVFSVSAL